MNEEQQQMIEDCEKRSARLTDWELKFIDSISHAESLTERQDEKLTSIWNKVTESG